MLIDLLFKVVERMLALKTKCLDPQGKPYILSIIGGTNNNPDKRNVSLPHKTMARKQSLLHVKASG